MHAPRPLAVALALLTLIALSAPVAAQDDVRAVSLEMYLDMETVSNPQISPDGAQVVYTRGWIDKMNDSRESSIWIMNADGSRARHLVDGSGPIWSPDGTRIAYTAPGEPDGTQIWVRWMDAEGATSQITRLENSPSGIRWSPDGEHLSFTMDIDSDPAFGVDVPGRPDGAEWTPAPRVVTRANYRRDRVGFTDDSWTHVFVVPAEGGTARQLTDGQWNHGTAEWMPSGEELVFTSLRTDDADLAYRESEIYAVTLDGEIRQLTTRRGQDASPLPSPDGSLIAYSGQDFNEDSYRNSGLWIMGPNGENPREISGDFDRQVTDVQWAHDGSGLWVTANSEGGRNLYWLDRDGGMEQVSEGAHLLQLSSFTADGVAVGTYTDPMTPSDIVRFDLSDPADRTQLTRVNADVFAGVTWGETEEIWYESVGGERIQGWIVKPPNFDPDRNYPLMLSIHGGPHAMYNVGFNFRYQEHAANDYVILYTNPRGSTGYGSRFANLIEHAYPGDDYHDLMAGVDQVLEQGYVDEDRMFVYGCSGGGVLTSWVVGQTDRFAAASANCPVTNWFSFVGTTDGSVYWYNNFESYPWEDPSEHLRRSPIMYVGNVTTPTMLMTGVGDLRTPMPQTEEYYAALTVLGVPTAMIRFNDEWHGTSSNPSNYLRTQLFLREWFEMHSGTTPVMEDDR